MVQVMYALPQQTLSCSDIDLPNVYFNSDFTPVKHPFKDAFDIQSYNSMWLEDT